MRRFGAALAAVAIAASAAEPSPRAPAAACTALQGLQFYNVTVTGAVDVPAAGALPAYCRVTGHEAGSDHDMEVRLPTQWRGRYVQRGGGGFDGRIPEPGSAAVALRRGAAQGVNNGGHRDPSGAALRGDPRATARYAHTAILTATLFGKAVTRAYYGEPAAFSYYEGCSNGGRGALNAAARYGTEFDGVVAMAPTFNMSGIVPAMTLFGTLPLPAAPQLQAVHAAAIARCDALDGARDGIVARWQACDFDPGRHVPESVGLAAQQVEALRTVWRDLHEPRGEVIYSALGFADLTQGAAIYGRFGNGHMGFIVHEDPRWQPPPGGLDLATELPLIRSVLEDRYQFSASAQALAQYLRSGRRILAWHGAEDPILSHRDTIRTWARVTAAAGEPAASANARLYIAPGVAHCGGGPGADAVDLLGTMMDWVEGGAAPGTLTASRHDASGRPQFSRPLCEYPAWPRYRGRGDVDEAASHECVTE